MKAVYGMFGLLAFIVLATANGGGYRYGISDQAFYVPAVLHAIDPDAFPRDRPLIEAQARLMVGDEVLAATMRATGLELPTLFAAGYVLSLSILFGALIVVGRSLYAHASTIAALLAAFTLRHQITRTSANTLEPYFHPRMLAFAVCAIAVAAVLRRRPAAAIALVAVAALVHPTTAAWFAVLIGVALIVASPRLRPLLLGAAFAGVVSAVWMLSTGRPAGAFGVMDAEWRAALVTKTTLFPNQWPLTAWAANLGTATLWAWAYLDRRRRGLATPEDTGLLAGGATLVALFLSTLPFVAAGVSLLVQLQISRVFWIVDLLATVYLLGVVDRRVAPRMIPAVAALLLAFSVSRGVFALWVEHPERRLFSAQLADSEWHDAMRWLASQPVDVHVLADPGHAWRFGSSVRVSAGRDVFLEDVKDAAIGIYSRDVAIRVLERSRVLGDFSTLTPAAAHGLAQRYDLDYLVSSAPMALPVAYRNREFTIYRLSADPAS